MGMLPSTYQQVVDNKDRIDSIVTNILEISSTVDALSADMVEMQECCGEVKETISDLSSEVESMKSDIERIRERLTTVEGTVAEHDDEIDNMKNDIDWILEQLSVIGAYYIGDVILNETTQDDFKSVNPETGTIADVVFADCVLVSI